MAVAAIPVASVCFFATLAIYAGNSSEFLTAYFDLVLIYLPYVCILIAALGSIGLVMDRDALHRYEAFLFALAVLFWLQGSILVWDYGVLDGRRIDWLSGSWRGVVDVSIWIAVLLLAIVAHTRVRKFLRTAALGTVAIQILIAAMTLLGNADIVSSKGVIANTDGRDAVMRFSKQHNIVHIVMDGFQSDIFANILAGSSERDIKTELRGFVYYEDNLGAYPYTQLTVPGMLSGKLFRNEIPVDDFIDETMRGNTIINTAYVAGYAVDIAAPVALRNVYAQGSYSNAYGISSSGHVDASDFARVDAAKLIDLALFRVVPHFAKALVRRDELWVFQAGAHSDSYLQMQYFSDLAFLNDLSAAMEVDREEPVYKMIHVMLSHKPIVANQSCEYGGRKPTTREYVKTHAQCGLNRVLNVFQRMRDLGIYDNSLIVLMADHGAWVPVENLPQSEVVDSLTVAMATPLLAIKAPGAAGPFRVSRAPTSIIDVPATIADIVGLEWGSEGVPLSSLNPSSVRTRQHLIYSYGINPKAKGYLFPMQEFSIDGSPYDVNAWRKGRRYPPQSVIDDGTE